MKIAATKDACKKTICIPCKSFCLCLNINWTYESLNVNAFVYILKAIVFLASLYKCFFFFVESIHSTLMISKFFDYVHSYDCHFVYSFKYIFNIVGLILAFKYFNLCGIYTVHNFYLSIPGLHVTINRVGIRMCFISVIL